MYSRQKYIRFSVATSSEKKHGGGSEEMEEKLKNILYVEMM